VALGGKLDGEDLVALRESPKRYGDGAGLYFVVQASGSAAWAYRYMMAGVAREMGLGLCASARSESAPSRLAICLNPFGATPTVRRSRAPACNRAENGASQNLTARSISRS
jgi:hypothetical protein